MPVSAFFQKLIELAICSFLDLQQWAALHAGKLPQAITGWGVLIYACHCQVAPPVLILCAHLGQQMELSLKSLMTAVSVALLTFGQAAHPDRWLSWAQYEGNIPIFPQ